MLRDWPVPDVKVAYMQEISETATPYSYRHRCHEKVEFGE
jgi:hypothetical protein